jgi:hypothetical protein
MTDESPSSEIKGTPEDPDPGVGPQKRPSLSDYGYTDDRPARHPVSSDGDAAKAIAIIVVLIALLGVIFLVMSFVSYLGCMDLTAGCT